MDPMIVRTGAPLKPKAMLLSLLLLGLWCVITGPKNLLALCRATVFGEVALDVAVLLITVVLILGVGRSIVGLVVAWGLVMGWGMNLLGLRVGVNVV